MDTIRKTLPYYTAPTSVIANTFLIVLIIFKSPTQMGNYKHLLIGVSIFELLYGVLDIVTETTVLSIGPSFVVVVPYKDRFFGRNISLFFNCLYCAFFGFSMGMFVIIFAYRLFVATENKILKHFTGCRIIIWFSYPIFYGFVFGIDAWIPYSPSKEMDDIVRFPIEDTLNMSLDDVTYTGPLFFSPVDNSVRYSTLFVSFVQYILTASSLILVIYFGLKCYFHIISYVNITDMTSLKFRSIQKQLFVALVFQALVPVILMHIPVTVLYSCSLLNIVFNPFSVATTIALFPALDPFPTIFIVKSYRVAVFGIFHQFFKCLRRKPNEVSVGYE